MAVARFVLGRLYQLIPTLFLISVVVFLLVHLAPGDPITAMAGPGASADLIKRIQDQYHLNDPLPVQYGLWLSHLLHGNFGRSIQTGQPVAVMIWQRVGVTVALAVCATIFAVVLAVPLGILSALTRGRSLDVVSGTFTSLAISLPNFFTAIVFIVVFGVVLRFLPIAGYRPFTQNPLTSLQHLVMPSVALGLPYLALLSRLVRSEMLDVLNEDFVRTAKAKGLMPRAVIFRHAFRNALIPAVQLLSLNFASLLGGTVIIEQIFALPGLGNMVITAVLQRDFPVVQGITIILGIVFVASSLVADLLSASLDPRVVFG